ncbi:hypothetical protein [Alkalihalobacillus sp. AL-G]|uniref:hypothetical protein n=1 Tax=Alkalihalobacillus sp. AL-G TaxID=2926399 RepID=UPI00272D990E|nr:hypothetical protein [Alkalihalobacillus sp. AL-G]WLD94437.1 hypothetical protein MOJ78_05985 [Alkalihalobacillus sp. AL-G]
MGRNTSTSVISKVILLDSNKKNIKKFFADFFKPSRNNNGGKKSDKGKKKPRVNVFDINNPNSFKNSKVADVEKYLDETLDGFTKKPLKISDGVRYFKVKVNHIR